jgi:hypothetical protein
LSFANAEATYAIYQIEREDCNKDIATDKKQKAFSYIV